jgi:hypothetical protein
MTQAPAPTRDEYHAEATVAPEAPAEHAASTDAATAVATAPVEAAASAPRLEAPIAAPIRIESDAPTPSSRSTNATSTPATTVSDLDPANVAIDDLINTSMATELIAPVNAGAKPEATSETQSTTQSTTKPSDSESSSSAAAEPDLAQAVEELMKDAAPTATKAPEHASADQIDSLDQQLAGIGDDLIAGDIVPGDDHAPALSEHAAAEGSSTPSPSTTASTPTSALASAASPVASKPTEAVPTSAAAAPSALHAPLPPKSVKEAKPKVKVKRPRTTPRIVTTVLTLLSRPLLGKSAACRNSVAVIAIANLAMAGYVWAYVAVLRPKEPPPPPAVEPTVHLETAKEGEGHGAKKDDKKDAHGTAKKDAKKDPKKGAKKKPEAAHH